MSVPWYRSRNLVRDYVCARWNVGRDNGTTGVGTFAHRHRIRSPIMSSNGSRGVVVLELTTGDGTMIAFR